MERWGVRDLKEQARTTYVSPLDMAEAYAYTGNKDQTLNYLEQAYRVHAPWLAFIQRKPVLDFVRSEPRFREIVHEMGLPEAK